MRRQALMAMGLALAAGAASGAGDLSLERCVAAALEANPGLEAAQHRVAAAQAARRQAWSAYYPWASAGVSAARSDNPPQAFMMTLNQRAFTMEQDFNNPDDTDNVRLSLGARYRLYDPSREANRAMAGEGVKLAGAALEAARNGLVYEVTRGYYGGLRAKAFVAVQEQSVTSLEESLRVARERFAAGSSVKTDVLNLEVRLAEAREDLIRASNGVQLAVAALNAAIGRDMAGPDSLADGGAAAGNGGAEAPDWAAATPDARPELRLARAREALAGQELRKARRQYGPTVSAFGSMDWDSDDLAGMERSYMAGVAADMDLFTGFGRGAAVRRAAEELAAARADVERVGTELRLDLTQAVLGAREARERLGVAEKSVASAEEALRITRERYEKGAADITELLTAQVGLTAIRSRRVAALYDYRTALSNVDRAQGLLGVRDDGQ